MSKHDRNTADWNAMAELDPLWAILSDPEEKFGGWEPQEFFSDGDREAKRVLGMCEANGVRVSYGRLLDFGCGVGRMTSSSASQRPEASWYFNSRMRFLHAIALMAGDSFGICLL
jgi:hypothetical protein